MVQRFAVKPDAVNSCFIDVIYLAHKINTIGNPENQKLSRKKLMAYKKKTLGNPRYAKEPTYYVPKDADDVGEININGTFYSVGMNSHMLILKKSHVYQPLEIE